LDRTQFTDLLVDADQPLAEFLKAMELGNFLLGLAQSRRAREGFGDGLVRIPVKWSGDSV
jgi:hypothetical protein